MPISDDIENQLGFSDKMYIPEQVVIEWLNLSAIITTYSLVFYNMARSGSLKVHPSLAIFISISLILISTAYMIYSLIPYSKRMTFLANTCKKSQKCNIKSTRPFSKRDNFANCFKFTSCCGSFNHF